MAGRGGGSRDYILGGSAENSRAPPGLREGRRGARGKGNGARGADGHTACLCQEGLSSSRNPKSPSGGRHRARSLAVDGAGGILGPLAPACSFLSVL